MGNRVLIVDDNPINLKLASVVLEAAGFAVQRATDAEQALAVLSDTTPDLILMDLALPGMDGVTLTQRLKREPRFKNVAIVALTASAMKGDERKFLDAGCDGYISKPIDTRTFAERVRHFIKAAAA